MCGRYTISSEQQYLEHRFKARFQDPFFPIFNAYPSQKLPVITNDRPDKIQLFNWGLHPTWFSRLSKKKDGLINVRRETLIDKKIFSSDLEQRRCLIPANGFFEWQKQKTSKQPMRILLKKEPVFAFAGLWEINQDSNNQPINSFAILTTTPAPSLQKIHNRMPVILEPGEEKAWLDNRLTEKKHLALLDPFPDSELTHHPIPNLVNNPRNNSPDILIPLSST